MDYDTFTLADLRSTRKELADDIRRYNRLVTRLAVNASPTDRAWMKRDFYWNTLAMGRYRVLTHWEFFTRTLRADPAWLRRVGSKWANFRHIPNPDAWCGEQDAAAERAEETRAMGNWLVRLADTRGS